MNKFVFFLLSVLILFLTFHGGVFAGGACSKCCLVERAGSTCDGVHEGWGVCWSDCWLQGYSDCSLGCICMENLQCNCLSCSPSFPCYCKVTTSPTPGATPTPPPTDWGKWFELGIFLFEDLNQNGVWDSNEQLIDPTNSQLSSYCGRHQITFVKSIGSVNIQLDCYPQEEGYWQGCDHNTYQLEQRDCWDFDKTNDACNEATNAWNFWNPAVRCGGDDDFGGTIPDYWTCPTHWGICNCDCGQSLIVREWGVKFCGTDCRWVTPAFSRVVVHDRPPSDNRQVHKLRISLPSGWAISPGSVSKFSNGANGSVGGILDPDGFKNPCFPDTCFYARAIGVVRENFPPEVVSLSGGTQVHLGEEKQFFAVFKDASRFVNNNLVKNDSFEYGTAEWSFYGGYNNTGNSGTIDSVGKFGGKSAKITVVSQASGVTPYAVWSQTIPNGGGKTVTISGWAKTSGSNTAHICYKNDTDNRVGGCETSVSGSSWQRISQTFTLPSDKQVSVRLQATGVGDAWFDGILVEEGTTQGIYTDIKSFQFNLENEPALNNGGIYDGGNYDASYWPLRLMFSKQHTVNGVVYRDGFYAASAPVTGNDWGIPVIASYDSLGGKWYLPSDMEVGDKFTLRGGPDKTYFTLGSDGTLIASWTVNLKEGFPLGSYNRTLHVVDLANFEDEVGETGFTILQVNGGYNNGKWDFHRDGTLQILLPAPWFQTKEGDVHAGQAISSQIPSTCTSPCLPYFSLKGDNNNGVISWGGDSSPSFGAGTAGEVNDWLANFSARRSYYEYFYRLLGSPADDNFNGNLSDIGADGVYYSADDVTINNDWNFPLGRKAVILINGKLTINKKIVVPAGSFLAFVTRNGIDVSKDLGGASNPVEGIFITDGTFNSSAGGTGNTQLIVKGAVIAGEFSLGRDLGASNKNTPAELFVYRSDFWLNSFPGLWGASHIWEELPP